VISFEKIGSKKISIMVGTYLVGQVKSQPWFSEPDSISESFIEHNEGWNESDKKVTHKNKRQMQTKLFL